MNAGGDFSRQSFLGPNSEEVFAAARAVIVGVGGGGSHIAQQLAHLGVGQVRLIDPDVIEASNLNRLIGGTQADVDWRSDKVEIAGRRYEAVRPWAKVVPAKSQWQDVDHLLRDAHAVFGCVDGYRQRMYLNGAARRFLVPYIDIGMDVASLSDGSFAVSGQMIMTLPHGPCMQCLGFLTSERLLEEENKYGDAGINPQVVWTNGTLASLAVGQFVRLLTPWFHGAQEYEWLELDGNLQHVTASSQPIYFPKGPCPHHRTEDLGDPFFDVRQFSTER